MYSVGIDLGGTNIAIGLCDKDLKIIDKLSIPTFSERGPASIVKDMASLTEKIISKNNLAISDIDFVGIAAPGSVDSVTGIIGASNNIKMYDFPMVEEFKKHIRIENVYIANDANAAALGEALCGAGRGTKSSVMVTLGTGVGGGVVLDGKLFAGGLNSFGAELGHIVISAGGEPCTCGRRGCFEAYSSATALIRMTKKKISELKEKNIFSPLVDAEKLDGKISGKTAFKFSKEGDIYAKEVVDDYVRYLSCGITNLINIFQPEVLAIGGGISNEPSLLLPVTEIVNREQYTKDEKIKTRVVIATLKNDAGIIGAAALGR